MVQAGPVDLPNAAQVCRLPRRAGPISRGEIWTLVCIAIGFGLWVTESLHGIATGMAALIMIGLLFVLGCLRFADYRNKMMWEMLFLIGG